MSDALISEPASVGVTAGSILRQARQARGLHIAALATSIKVTPQKLEALESDRIDELPDATFARALAQTVCRSLKIDSAPVLALLPQPIDKGLEHLSMGLNEPFRDRPGRRVPNELQFLKSPITLGALVLVIASLAVYLLPAGWLSENFQRASSASPDSAGVTPPPATSSTVESVLLPSAEPVASAPGVTSVLPQQSLPADIAQLPAVTDTKASAVPAPVPTGASGTLLLRASAASWIEVVDGRGTQLLSRMLQPGESVGLDGTSPLRVKIGNASATKVTFRGKAVDLQPLRDNVAKLELK